MLCSVNFCFSKFCMNCQSILTNMSLHPARKNMMIYKPFPTKFVLSINTCFSKIVYYVEFCVSNLLHKDTIL